MISTLILTNVYAVSITSLISVSTPLETLRLAIVKTAVFSSLSLKSHTHL